MTVIKSKKALLSRDFASVPAMKKKQSKVKKLNTILFQVTSLTPIQ
jgi:hypothetical protein